MVVENPSRLYEISEMSDPLYQFQEVPVSHWEDGFPMNQCADLPRLTVVMSTKGYRDMPATARLPVICTFGL